MAAHARLAPSSLRELELCPGRLNAIEALPPDRRSAPSVSGDTGTMLHEVLSVCAKSWASPPRVVPEDYVGQRLSVEHKHHPDVEMEFTKDHALMVQFALTYYAEMEAKYGAPGQYETKVDPGSRFHKRVPWVSDDPVRWPRNDCTGTADAIFKGRGAMEVVDFKSGYRYVPALTHQLVAYALGALAEHDLETQGPIQRVTLTILQPRGEGDRQRSHVMKDVELMDWALKFTAIAEASDPVDAPRRYGEEQCYFCPVKAAQRCPEFIAHMANTLTSPGADQDDWML